MAMNRTVYAVITGALALLGAGASAEQSVDISGQVLLGDQPVCALVLANGQHMFSCGGNGGYALDAPLDQDGRLSLFAFADGFAPYKTILQPASVSTHDIRMDIAGDGAPVMSVQPKIDPGLSPGSVRLFGRVNSADAAIGALVLANGGYAFTSMDDGEFDFSTWLADSGELELFAFADGFSPFHSVLWPERLLDRDGDGKSPVQGDCDDLQAAIGPGRPEVRGDGVDQDCDSVDPRSVASEGPRYDILEAINRRRVAGGDCAGFHYPPQPPLQWEQAIAEAVTAHARDMADNGFLDLTGSDGSTPEQRLVARGYAPTTVFEIWYGTPDSPDELVDWLFDGWACPYVRGPDFPAAAVANARGTLPGASFVDGDGHFLALTLSGSCSSGEGARRFVHGVLRDSYFWYDQVPAVVDYANYADAEALLERNKNRKLDRWSYITDREEYDNLFEAGRYVGYGFRSGSDDQGDLRIQFVYRDSPAERAGMRRGERILSINGFTVEQIEQQELWDGIYGEAELGVPVNLTLQAIDGSIRAVEMNKAWVTIDTVPVSRVLTADNGERVGYLLFQSFIETAPEALASAFRQFRESAVSELILDLRYNGGGRLDVARMLASLIGGAATEGEVFYRLLHNAKYRAWDQSMLFSREAQALDLERLLVITSEASCSASEAIVNGLRPFLPVVTVGAATCGKPVGMYGRHYCDKHVAPIEFHGVNAEGEGDYHDGIAADCPAADELDESLGAEGEASLATALAYLRDGACPPRVALAPRPLTGAGFRTGFWREIGAE